MIFKYIQIGGTQTLQMAQ